MDGWTSKSCSALKSIGRQKLKSIVNYGELTKLK